MPKVVEGKASLTLDLGAVLDRLIKDVLAYPNIDPDAATEPETDSATT